jgi:riboflavin synthase alpha subunit
LKEILPKREIKIGDTVIVDSICFTVASLSQESGLKREVIRTGIGLQTVYVDPKSAWVPE